MVAIFTGLGAGFERGSAAQLGSSGLLGAALQGRGGEGVFLNGASGALVLQRQDEFLAGMGPDAAIARTYNSQGRLSAVNEYWRTSNDRKVFGHSVGAKNVANATVKRLSGDGTEIEYKWEQGNPAETPNGYYKATDGAGAHDRLFWDGVHWTWVDGATQIREKYEDVGTGVTWRIVQQYDLDGNTLAFSYDGSGRLSRLTTDDGGYLEYTWDGSGRISTLITGYDDLATPTVEALTPTRTRYTYDGSGRLQRVTVDFTPHDDAVSDAKTYWTEYAYDGSSNRVSSILQKDGSLLEIGYEQAGANRVIWYQQTVAGSDKRRTDIIYDLEPGRTDVKVYTQTYVNSSTASLTTSFYYDANKQLTRIVNPPADGGTLAQTIDYAYDSDGNLLSATHKLSVNVWRKSEYVYDARGNATTITSRVSTNGTSWTTDKIVERSFDANNSLTRETSTGSTASQASTSLYSRYVYDTTKNRLHYAISAEGRVTEYRYDSDGLLAAKIEYTDDAHRYAISDTVPTKATMDAWRDGRAAGSSTKIVHYLYDARGNLKETKAFGQGSQTGVASTSEGYARTTFVHDQGGLLLSRQVEGQLAQTFVYDTMGRLIASTDLSGGTTSVSFNDAAQQTIVRTASAYNATLQEWEATGQSYITTSTYNKAGDLIAHTDSGSGANLTNQTFSYVYDRLGRLRQKITNQGWNSITQNNPHNTYYLYDNLGRMTAEIGQRGEVVEYRYDAAGRLIATANYTIFLSSTKLAQLAVVDNTETISSVRPAGHQNDLWSWTVYDTAGRVVETIAGDGAVQTFAYDSADRLIATTAYFTKLTTTDINALIAASATSVLLPASDAKDVVARTFYDGDGRVVGVLNAEGYLSQVIHNGAGQKVRERAFANATASNLRATGTFADLLASITQDPNRDRSIRHVYDGQGSLRFTVDALNYVTEYIYWHGPSTSEGWASGQVRKTIVHAVAISGTAYDYSSIKSAVASIHANDRVDHAVYNSRGQLRYTVDASGAVVRIDYDALGRAVKHTAYGERLVAAMNADVSLWESQLDTWSNTPANQTGARTTRSYYNNRDETVFVVDAEGYVLQRDYDGGGRIFNEYRYTTAISVNDATTTANVAAASKGTGVVFQYRYDAFGRLNYAMDPVLGHFELTSYSANGTVDAKLHGSWSDNARTYFYYDRAGKLITQQRFTSESANTDYLGSTATTIASSQRIDSGNGEYKALVTRLGEVQVLHRGEVIWSNGVQENIAGALYELRAETNGALKVYRIVSGVTTEIWSNGTSYAGATFLKIENNGNLVLLKGTPASPIDPLNPLWSSNSSSMTAHASSSFSITNTYAYDGLGNLIQVTGPGAATYTHDKLGRVKTATNALGVITTFDYDAFGAGVKTVEASGSLNRTSYAFFDQLGRVYLAMDAEGYVTKTDYNAFGEIEAVTRYLQRAPNAANVAVGVPPTIVGGDNGARTEFLYDKLGRVRESEDAEGAIELFEFNAFGQRSATRNKIGGWVEYTYNTRGLLVQAKVFHTERNAATPSFAINTFSYDSRGNLIQQVEAGLRTTTYGYDTSNRLVSKSVAGVSFVDSATAASAATTLTETFAYDSRGNLIEHRDASGARTLYWYDRLDRQTHTLSAGGVLTRTYYDALDNVVETRVYADTMALPSAALWAAPPKAGGAASAYRATRYEYDAIGRLTKTKAPDARIATYDGALTISAGGTTIETTYQYDALGNVVLVTDPRGSKLWLYYDRLGRKIVQIDAANYRTDWTYDANGNVTAERRYATAHSQTPTTPGGTADAPPTQTAQDRVTNFLYDLMGQRTSETRVGVQVHDGSGGHTTQDATILYSYTELGLVRSKTEATGDIIKYYYDLSGRMTKEIRFREQGVVDFSFVDVNGVNVTPTVEYSYNGLGNLTAARAVGQGAGLDRTTYYTYDAAGRLESLKDAAGFKRTYVYDKAGRVRREEYNRADFSGTTAATEALGYEYDVEGRVIRQGVLLKTGGIWSRDGASVDTAAFSYNTFGEIIRRGFAHYTAGSETNLVEAERFEYDGAGRLVKSNSGDGAWKYFMYDAAGNQTLSFSAQTLDFTNTSYDTLDEVLALWSGGTPSIATTNVAGLVATITRYDARNQATEVLEPKRQRNSTTWDNLSTTRTFNAFGEVAYEVNAGGSRVDYTYNTMGRRIKIESPAVEGRAENGRWYTGYNATTGALEATANTATTFRPVEHTYYDLSGRVVARRDANTSLTRYTLLAGTGYGGADALITEVTSADGRVVRTKYDVHGDARRVEDQLFSPAAPTQHVTTQNFDAMGRLVSMNRSNVLTDYYAYDGMGQRVAHWNSFHNPNGVATNHVELTSYDHQGRITQVVAMGGDVTTYSYVWDGGLATTGMVSGSLSAFGGWVKTTTYANSKTMTQKSDVFGHDVQKTDLGGHTSNLTYDRAGRLIQTSATFVMNGNTYNLGASSFQSYYNTGRLSAIYQNGGSRIVIRGGITGGGFDTFSYRGTDLAYDKLGNVVLQELREIGSYQGDGNYDSEGQWVTPDPIEFNRLISSQTSTFDALGRIVSWAEAGPVNSGPNVIKGTPLPPSTRAFTYDATGNIRRSLATYRALDAYGAAAASATAQDYWYRYDAMNRMVTSKGTFSGSVGTGSIVRGSTGVDTYYNYDGTRAYTLNNISGARREDYVYDVLGRVVEVKSGTNQSVAGSTAGLFVYDSMGRLTSQTDYASPGVVAYSRSVTYNAKNQVTSDDVSVWQGGALYRSLSSYDYGAGVNYALGSVKVMTTQRWKNGSDAAEADTRTENVYDWYDSAITAFVEHDPNVAVAGVNWSGYYYDIVGGRAQLNYVEIQDGRPRTVVFSSDMLGQIIRRDETDNLAGGDPHEVWYRYSGREMGYVGNNGFANTDYAQTINQRAGSGGTPGSFADYDLAYDPINAYEQGSRGGVYTVQSGDTLQAIASSLWGDSSLWWKLAEVNGLTAEDTLVEGQVLIIPVGVQSNSNNATTFQPYDPMEVLGDLSPTAQKPKRAKQCGAFGQFMLAAIAIIIVIKMGPAAMKYFAHLFAGGGAAGATAAGQVSLMLKGAATIGSVSGTATGAAAVGGIVAGGAVAGATASVVTQTIGVLTGIQEKFSWNAVAMSAVGGAVGGVFGATNIGGAGALGAGVRGALSSMVSQGIGVVTGLQKDFSWASVAASGLSAAAGKWAGNNLPGHAVEATPATDANIFASNMAAALVEAGARSLLDGSDFGDNMLAALPSAIMNTASSLANKAAAQQEEQEAQASAAAWAAAFAPVDIPQLSPEAREFGNWVEAMIGRPPVTSETIPVIETRENGVRVYAYSARPVHVRGNVATEWSFEPNATVIIVANRNFQLHGDAMDGHIVVYFSDGEGRLLSDQIPLAARPGEVGPFNEVPGIGGGIQAVGPPRQDVLTQFSSGALRTLLESAHTTTTLAQSAVRDPVAAGRTILDVAGGIWDNGVNTYNMLQTQAGRAEIGAQLGSWAQRTGDNIAWHWNNGTLADGVGQIFGGAVFGEITGGNAARALLSFRRGCFVAGTLIHTRAGLKPIEQISLEDFVLSRPEGDGEQGERRVINLVRYEDKAIFEIVIAASGGRAESFQVTAEHPFWVEGEGWVAASELKAGDPVRLAGPDHAYVVAVRDTGATADVFNFEVDGWHTYHVGELGVWVHNADCVRLLTGPSQIALNAENGRTFQRALQNSIGAPGNTRAVQVPLPGGTVTTIPDIWVARTGVLEAKNVLRINNTSQLRAQAQLARTSGQQFNLVVSPRTLTISRSLQSSITRTGGQIFEFDPATGTFRHVVMNGNRVVR